MFQGKIRVSNGFLLLAAALFWMDEGTGLLGTALFACVLHETGHILTAVMLGIPVKQINITAVGAEMYFLNEERISCRQDLLVTAAGPAASILSAWVAGELEEFVLAGMCLGQGVFNLLPVPPLDGGRFLHLALMSWRNGIWADAVIEITSLVVAVAAVGIGIVLLLRYGNPTLMFTACWLLVGRLKNKDRKKKKHLQKRTKCGNIPQSE